MVLAPVTVASAAFGGRYMYSTVLCIDGVGVAWDRLVSSCGLGAGWTGREHGSCERQHQLLCRASSV